MIPTRRYTSIDGLKGLLIFLIVFHHVFPMLSAAGEGSRILDAIPMTFFITIYGGDLGDCLFFMLSGFLMATGYRQRISGHQVPFPSYLWKRLAKLYPMYLLSNLAMLVMTVLMHGPSGINLQRIAFTALIQLGGGLRAHPYNGPSWFLSTLFLCYALYYLIAWVSSHATRYYCCLLGCVALGYAMCSAQWEFSFFNGGTGMGLMNFFLGCILCEVYPLLCQKQKPWLPLLSLAILGGSFYLMMRYGVEIIAGDSLVAFTFVVSPIVIYLAIAFLPFTWLLETRPIQFLGKISLSVFFWHYPIFIVMQYVCQFLGLTVTEAVLPMYLVLMFLLSFLAWRIDERRKASR